MRISELAAESGVPLATIKFYQREGLLLPGVAVSKTQAQYGDEHVARLRLIRALSALPGYNVAVLRQLFGLIDDTSRPTADRVVEAVQLVPARLDSPSDTGRAADAIDSLGANLPRSGTAVSQLASALNLAEQAGMPCSEETLAFYWNHLHAIAEFEINQMPIPADSSAAVTYAVAGTAAYESLILALRRLAHQHLFTERSRP